MLDMIVIDKNSAALHIVFEPAGVLVQKFKKCIS